MKRYFILLLAMGLCGTVFAADPDPSAGTSGASFLKIGVGARPAAMGGCFVGLADDVNALYWNPAGITQLQKMQATFMHNTWMEGVSYEFAGLTYPLGFDSTVGASIIMLNTGNIAGHDASDVEYNYSASDFVINGTYGQLLNESMLIGATFKSISETIDTESANAIGIDVGGIYKLSEELVLGAAIRNFSMIPIQFVDQAYQLPMNIGVGASFKTSGYSFDNPTVITADFNIPSDNSSNVGVGVEYWLSETFAARGGYRMQLGGSNDLSGSLDGITMGCGVKYAVPSGQSFNIDLAIVPYGTLGNTTRLSVVVKFE